MKLSVIVPIYNAEKTLKKCVDSILSQNYSNIEIVLVDDGSSDDSPKICDGYANVNDKIIVHHKENQGLVAARKTGVSLATGDYIGFVDSDDYIDGNMFSSYMEEAEKSKSDIIMGGIITDYPNCSKTTYPLLPTGIYNKTAIEKSIIPNMLMVTGFFKYGIIPGVVTKIFKKELIKQSLMEIDDELTLGEDVAITSYSLIKADSISIIEKAGYHYIQTESSMIRGFNPKKFDAARKMYCCISRINNYEFQKQIGAFYACILYGILQDCVLYDKFTRIEAINKMREVLGDDISIKALKCADVSKWGLSDKVKVFLMKHKMANAIKIILRR